MSTFKCKINDHDYYFSDQSAFEDYVKTNKIKSLDIFGSRITQLPILYDVEKIDMEFTKITKLRNIPINLKKLSCRESKIKIISNLPDSLEELDCTCSNTENLRGV